MLGLLYAKTDSGTPCIAAKLLSSHGMTAEAVTATMKLSQPNPMTSDGMATQIHAAYPDFTPALCRILTRAEKEANRFRLASDASGAVVGSEHLLFSLLCETDAVAHQILARHNLPLHELYGDVLSFLSAVTAEEAIFSGHTRDHTDDDVRQADDASHTQTEQSLDELPFLLDMTACAAAGKYDSVVARDEEEESVLRILLHKQKNNPCLLGEAGVGKTAIVEGLAARMIKGTVPSALIGTRILSLNLGGMLAGAKYRGEFEDRLRRVLEYCRDHTQTVILFIDEVHMLMGAGAAEGTVDAANLLKPALSRGEIRVIGATTRTEYDKTIGRDGAMSRRFQPVAIEEPDKARALRMIEALIPRLEAHHGVHIAEDVPGCAIAASVRCLPEYYLPDKAIDLLDDACAAVRTETSAPAAQIYTAQKRRDDALLAGDLTAAQQAIKASSSSTASTQTAPSPPTVTADDIYRAAERRTGIRLTSDANDSARYLSLEAHLGKLVLGQTDAIAAIAEVLRRQHVGVTADRRTPISFLFYGPSGVGKTAVCEALAAHLFDSSHAFLRFDMSEYREAHTVSRLIGAPPGYIGHDDGGTLTSAVRHRPYALLLFDVFEQAHPDIRHLIVQLLDRGTLTDSRGNAVSFRHTIVVLTAATDAASRTHPLGFGKPAANDTDHHFLSRMFSAELLSHIDACICFHALTEDVLTQILREQLSVLSAHMAERGISLEFDDALIPYVLSQQPKEQGARGLCRTAAQMIESPIANALLDNTISSGDHVRMTIQDEKIVLFKGQ